MILIFSISTDSTTTEVVDWLKAFDPNISIVRINNDLQDVKFKQMIYTHNEKSLWVQTSQGELIDLFKAKVVWYRKGGCMFRNTFTNGNDTAFPFSRFPLRNPSGPKRTVQTTEDGQNTTSGAIRHPIRLHRSDPENSILRSPAGKQTAACDEPTGT